MTYSGRVDNGVIVLDGDVRLPDGTVVAVAVPDQAPVTELGQRLMRLAGRAKNLPADAAENHDHYLYGTPKR
ncbi:MAG: hypothetical protein ACAI43_24190 [Phycisphaerae bacterium]|nr:hypothetical protein [Tepidisphaeraceae bacterium]